MTSIWHVSVNQMLVNEDGTPIASAAELRTRLQGILAHPEQGRLL